MNREELCFIQNHIDYQFKNPDLLVQAFTRSSYSAENDGCDNEVLEFIGDKALDLIVVKYLSDSYGGFAHEDDDYSDGDPDDFWCEYDEGKLSELKAHLVQKRMLARRIDLLGFAEFLLMGKGDTERHIEQQDSVKEDLFEAIIGAVTLDSGWDIGILESVVDHMLCPDVELDNDGAYENFIGKVQDWAIETEGELPLYHTQQYSESHMYTGSYVYGENVRMLEGRQPEYMCFLKLPGREEVFLEVGQSKYEARMGAAQAAYKFIEENGLIPTIKDEIENPNYEESVGQLETLARRGYFSIPTYEFEEPHDKDGNPVWDCECSIEKIDKTTHGEASSKKDAKKQAAFEMLLYVLEEG